MSNHDKALAKARTAGCKPFWYDGIIGPAWHCGCPEENNHYADQQCSVVKFYKEKA